MALELTKLLLITFDTLIANAPGIKDTLKEFDSAEQEAVLQRVHDVLLLTGDKVYVFDSRFKVNINRQLQLYIGLHFASLMSDTPAGTGSVSSQSIDSFSQSNTMAKNNSPFDDSENMTQYGTAFLNLISSTDPMTHFMI